MYQATETGMPIMRALILAYPDDERLGDMWDEYLYGDALLVAPVTAAQTTERSVYLPAGRWMNYDDKRTVYGGATTVKAIAPLGTIPVYVRESAIVPRGDIVKLNNNWTRTGIRSCVLNSFLRANRRAGSIITPEEECRGSPRSRGATA